MAALPSSASFSYALIFPRGRVAVGLLLMLLCLLAPMAHAQSFPKLSGQVVDAANLLSSPQEATLMARLASIETRTGRQVVVATIPDLQGYDIADYGYRLGRAWGIGAKETNDGALLIVAPNDRKVRIEVGYGLEGILTDAMSSRIIREDITPRFKAGDMAGGIQAGVDRIGALLALPPDEARALAAKTQQDARQGDGGGVLIFWIALFVIFFVVLPLMSRMKGGRRYRGGGGAPVIIWGPGDWGSGGGGGSSWGGGGGFSGGGGSFGGGGASGDW